MPTQSSDSTPQKLRASMGGVVWFKHILARVHELQRLQGMVRDCLDWELAQHCYFLEIQKDYVVLAVENATWATKLRYASPELVKLLKKFPEFAAVKKVRCSVRPVPPAGPARTLPAPNPITQESADFIANVANGIVDERLKNALLKLSRKVGNGR